MIKLGVNIDHIATVRQARKEVFPDPVVLAKEAVRGGANGITAHLREDRRHIQDQDLFKLKREISVPLNMEMATSAGIVEVAVKLQPQWVCLVPEKRLELTTEGGLNVHTAYPRLKTVIPVLHKKHIFVSLFVDPTIQSMKLAHELGADAVELHTGTYARVWKQKLALKKELNKIITAAKLAKALGLFVNAGHGLDYENVNLLVRSFAFNELNIGFSIVSRAFEVGMANAVKEMKQRMKP